jgi:hypothetical protein
MAGSAEKSSIADRGGKLHRCQFAAITAVFIVAISLRRTATSQYTGSSTIA